MIRTPSQPRSPVGAGAASPHNTARKAAGRTPEPPNPPPHGGFVIATGAPGAGFAMTECGGRNSLSPRRPPSYGRIAVVEGGKVAELGTHDELLARGGRYAELFELQAVGYR